MTDKKHILVISQYFYPEQFRINDICQEWIKRGYKVTVITGIPNYPQGKFYKGYGWFKKRKETWNGIDIIRIPLISRGKSSIRLALNYFSFVVSGWFWKLFTRIKADKVFIYEVSPMTQALVGVWFAKKRKIPCCIYVTDLWPENFEVVTGIHNRMIISPIERMVKKIYRACDKIFISSRGFLDSIQDKGVPAQKIQYWPQYAEDFYQYKPLSEVHDSSLQIREVGKFHLLFAGNIGEAQGLSVLVKTAVLLKEKGIDNILFCLVGDGRYKEKLSSEIKDNNVEEMFRLYPKIPPDQIPDVFAQVEASLICLSKSEIFALTVPAKTQSCLACGKPILVCADGEIQNIITEAGCGFVADAGDAETLAGNIEKLQSLSVEELKKMGTQAINYYDNNFNKLKLLDQMDEYLLS